MILVFLHYTTAAEQLRESPTTARHLSKGLEHRMSLHLHSHHSWPCTLHEPPTQIPVLRLLYLLKAVAACRFASPQLRFMPGPISSRAASFECDLQGLPEGREFYPRAGAARGRAEEQRVATPRVLGLQGHLPWGDSSPSKCSNATKAQDPIPSSSFFFFSSFLRLTVVLFWSNYSRELFILVRTLISFLLDDKHL